MNVSENIIVPGSCNQNNLGLFLKIVHKNLLVQNLKSAEAENSHNLNVSFYKFMEQSKLVLGDILELMCPLCFLFSILSSVEWTSVENKSMSQSYM